MRTTRLYKGHVFSTLYIDSKAYMTLVPTILRSARRFTSTRVVRNKKSRAPLQSEFALTELDVLSTAPRPAVSIDSVLPDGFLLSDEQKHIGNILVVNGERFEWKVKPRISKNGTLDFSEDELGLLEVVWPKPELLVIGTGATCLMLSKGLKDKFVRLGLQVDMNSTVEWASMAVLTDVEKCG